MTNTTRTTAITIGAVDAALFVLAGILTVATTIAIQSPDADPLTGIGYLLAAVLAALAGVSLLLTWLSVLVRDRWRVVCLVLAVVVLAPVALLLGTWWV